MGWLFRLLSPREEVGCIGVAASLGAVARMREFEGVDEKDV
jgi:hypothetical protein